MVGKAAYQGLQEIYQSVAACAVQILSDLFFICANGLREAWVSQGYGAYGMEAAAVQSVVAGRDR